ncbi:MAG: phosphoribosylanthranilate isomerase [Chlorobium phaeobacteroides]|nr:phosphoribosylanthranilate isomerase [Chlorobium phaeobacteroides]MBL6956642.1 phosphoribosylanthranilate isomerase [Chlorobium phaeobacteroides]
MTKIKICGITNLDDAIASCTAGADALGFNFSKASPRYIQPETALSIIEKLPPFISCVGVFVEQEPHEVNQICNLCRLDHAQLHAERYTAEKAVAVRGAKVIRVFRTGPDFTIDAVRTFAEKTGITSFLFDAYRLGQPGGTGHVIEQQLAQKIFRETEHIGFGILAGGLKPENVAEATSTVRPYAVDTASGVEESPGRKNHQKIRDFVSAVHRSAELL